MIEHLSEARWRTLGQQDAITVVPFDSVKDPCGHLIIGAEQPVCCCIDVSAFSSVE
jgi:hypothetical protein